MTMLDHVLDDCPITFLPVDFRRCAGCPHSIMKERRLGSTCCSYPKAKHDPHTERIEAARAGVSIEHILHPINSQERKGIIMNLYTWTIATALGGNVVLAGIAEDANTARANIMNEINENYEDLDVSGLNGEPESVTNVTEHPVIVAF